MLYLIFESLIFNVNVYDNMDMGHEYIIVFWEMLLI